MFAELEWWQILLGVVVGLAVLNLLVVIHELGHTFMALRNGVEIEEFGIGFPPAAWKTVLKKKLLILPPGTVFSLNWLPIGGFCKMKGETDNAKGTGAYGETSLWAKTQILLGGILANIAAACVIFTVMMWFGIPRLLPNQVYVPADTRVERGPVIIGAVAEDSPAEEAGLRGGYEVKSISGENVIEGGDVSRLTEKYRGQTIQIEYVIPAGVFADNPCKTCDWVWEEVSNEDRNMSEWVLLNEEKGDTGYLGVSVGTSETLQATWSAPITGIALTGQLLWETLKGVGILFANLGTGIWGSIFGTSDAANLSIAGNAVAGPVGILGGIFPAALAGGLAELVLIAGIISVSLAVMNLLIIPGLDGGRLFLTLLFRWGFKKPLTEDTEGTINAVGMMVLFGLMILITVVDVTKIL